MFRHWSKYFSCNPWKTHTRVQEKCDREGATERNHCALTVSLPSAFALFTHCGAEGTEATSGNNKEGNKGLEWSEVEPGEVGGEKVISLCVLMFGFLHLNTQISNYIYF